MNDDLLIGSKDIYDRAVLEFNPKAIVLMFSGGDDSLVTYHVAKQLGIEFDYVIHGNTRTGILDTTEFVRDKVEKMGDNYLEADAGNSYLDYVLRKGFFGKGSQAHNFSYRILKYNHFGKIVSKHLRMGIRNYNVLFVNGARRMETERRKITMINPIKVDPANERNIWVNLINEWTKEDCANYLFGNSIKRNPVSINLCRSGECMCGTMQSIGDRAEASYFYPKWGKDLDALEREVKAMHGFGWGENKPKENKGQLDLFQPMCIGCTKNEL